MSCFDCIWPRVAKTTSDDKQQEDLEKIGSASWGKDAEAFLEEARRLRDIENNRKTSAETKSQIYLAALLALIPILITLSEHDALKGIMEFSSWHQIAGFILFALGIAYGIGAFVSSFRALMVTAYHRVDIDEIVSSASAENSIESITKEILKSVRLDRSSVNQKISHVMVTHQLIFRMGALLLLALVLITVAPNLPDIFPPLKDLMC